ncbi:steroid 17-alpha-hydroxylase/17,20 lyase-like [Lethenteron reissneri]|uniref:steroid 17-alpha-hydroxylase/17,20 lyase-like n=1 Tax=Lethenteron reissneri TaxID=7753 RepID=UPI002AB722C6|nr:steroid 17-alpha-hydroxylase/17,20 lyase-like [Lethenteron reissneri]
MLPLLDLITISVLIIIVVAIVVVASSLASKSPRDAASPKPTPKLPSLPSLPVLGSLLSLRGTSQPHVHLAQLGRTHGAVARSLPRTAERGDGGTSRGDFEDGGGGEEGLAARSGGALALKLGARHAVLVTSAQHAHHVLIRKGRQFGGRVHAVTTDILSRGGKDIAFTDVGPSWRFHRKLVLGSLYTKTGGMGALEKIVMEEALALISALGETTSDSTSSATSDPEQELSRASTNVIMRLVFGTRYSRGDPGLQTMLDYSRGIVEIVAKDDLVDIFPWLRVFPSMSLRKLRACVRARDKLLEKQLQEHRATFQEGVTRDLLDRLLEAARVSPPPPGVELTDDHLLMIAGDIFGAGVETSTTVMKWIFVFMVHHPEIQGRIHAELDEVIGRERPPCASDRGKLPFMEATINEVLRIRPVAAILIPHVAMCDTTIGEFPVKKGTEVIVNLWAVHHDESLWEKPDEFNPGRFLSPCGRQRRSMGPNEGFFPFGAGPRVCLGEALAKLQLFLFTASILQRFSAGPIPGKALPDLEGIYGVVLRPRDFHVALTPRV